MTGTMSFIRKEPEMEYIKIRFGSDFERLGAECEKAIDDMFRQTNPMFTLSQRRWHPQMDIYETPEEIIILAEIAGVDKDDLEVEINTKAVKIFGHRKEVPLSTNGTYRLAEIQYGQFERVLFLPVPIDPEVVSAAFINGLLQIRLAKKPMDQTHRIPIEEG